jgi:HD-GYP domain-containing protein (c-di-GMP phosphodiesterase class II)
VEILAIADVFEALMASRPYRKAYSFSGDVDKIVSEIFKVLPELEKVLNPRTAEPVQGASDRVI